MHFADSLKIYKYKGENNWAVLSQPETDTVIVITVCSHSLSPVHFKACFLQSLEYSKCRILATFMWRMIRKGLKKMVSDFKNSFFYLVFTNKKIKF